MKYKYFTEEAVRACLDPSTPAEVVVRTVCDCVKNTFEDPTPAEVAEIQREAQCLAKEIKEMLVKTKAFDRQSKIHHLYVDIKIKEVKHGFMTALTTCNNAAFIVIRDAIDRVRKLPEYNAKFSKLRRAIEHAEQVWEEYERGLRHSNEHWLDPAYFSDEEKKRFRADLTQEEFAEFWQCIGGKAYGRITDEVNVLRNKFRLSIANHGIPNETTAAYVLSGASMLILCEAVYRKTVNQFAKNYNVNPREAHSRMRDFSLKQMELAWGKCVRLMGPVTKLDPQESRNVELTLEQLIDHWNDFSFFVQSEIETVEEFPEIFRTKGEQKKYLRELNEKLNDNPNG